MNSAAKVLIETASLLNKTQLKTNKQNHTKASQAIVTANKQKQNPAITATKQQQQQRNKQQHPKPTRLVGVLMKFGLYFYFVLE